MPASQGTWSCAARPGGAKLSHWAQANSGITSSPAPAPCASATRASTLASQSARLVSGGSRLVAQRAMVSVSTGLVSCRAGCWSGPRRADDVLDLEERLEAPSTQLATDAAALEAAPGRLDEHDLRAV